MKVIVPIELTSSMIISSSIPEPDAGEPAVWSSGNSYGYDSGNVPAGDRVIYNRKIYETLRNISLSLNAKYTPEQSVTRRVPFWVEIGSTNRWRVFDEFRSTYSTFTGGTGSVVIEPEQLVNSLAVLNASNVNYITVTAVSVSDSITRYTQVHDVQRRDPVDTWNEYFFRIFETSKPLVITNLPTSYGNLRITIEFSGSGSMNVDNIILGNYHTFGKLQIGGTSDTINFSTMDRDIYGNAILVPRRSVSKIGFSAYIDRTELDTVIDLRSQLNAVSALWVGIDDPTNEFYEMYLIYGIYRDFTIEVDNPIGPTVGLELEEL